MRPNWFKKVQPTACLAVQSSGVMHYSALMDACIAALFNIPLEAVDRMLQTPTKTLFSDRRRSSDKRSRNMTAKQNETTSQHCLCANTIARCYLDWPSTELTADIWLPIHGITELDIHFFYLNKRQLDTAKIIHFSGGERTHFGENASGSCTWVSWCTFLALCGRRYLWLRNRWGRGELRPRWRRLQTSTTTSTVTLDTHEATLPP